jgi:two-component system copper resistance phosphate regulon response regulator CusR
MARRKPEAIDRPGPQWLVQDSDGRSLRRHGLLVECGPMPGEANCDALRILQNRALSPRHPPPDTTTFVKLLIVEDDPKTAQAVAHGLAASGFEVDVARTGDEGCAAIQKATYDLLVLDWMLPGRDGLELVRTLRAQGQKTPVVLLTARDALEDRVLGLESGADDYLVKPFAFAELLARIKALLRRAGDAEPLRKRIGDLALNLETREAARASESISLTPREFELLAYLVRHKGQTVTRAMLAKDVWRESQRATPIDNVIDVHVAHLRRKVDGAHETKLIHTVRGVGFVLREEKA